MGKYKEATGLDRKNVASNEICSQLMGIASDDILISVIEAQ